MLLYGLGSEHAVAPSLDMVWLTDKKRCLAAIASVIDTGAQVRMPRMSRREIIK
jgi:hypothetical protein